MRDFLHTNRYSTSFRRCSGFAIDHYPQIRLNYSLPTGQNAHNLFRSVSIENKTGNRFNDRDSLLACNTKICECLHST